MFKCCCSHYYKQKSCFPLSCSLPFRELKQVSSFVPRSCMNFWGRKAINNSNSPPQPKVEQIPWFVYSILREGPVYHSSPLVKLSLENTKSLAKSKKERRGTCLPWNFTGQLHRRTNLQNQGSKLMVQNSYFETLENSIIKFSCCLSCWFHVFHGESHHKGILIRHFFTQQPVFKLNGRKQSMPWWINCQSNHIPTFGYLELPQPEEHCGRIVLLLTLSALCCQE